MSCNKKIITDLEKTYIDPANTNYFSRGVKAFENEDYMTAAMYLVALLDVRINKLVNFPSGIRHYSQKFSDDGFVEVKQSQFEEAASFFKGYIKDGFDDSLRDYIQSEEYIKGL